MEGNGLTGPIWVLVEQSRGCLTFASKEMLQDAREAAHLTGLKVLAILLNGGQADDPWAEQVGCFGADFLIQVDVKGVEYLSAEVYACVLDRLSMDRDSPSIVLIAGTVEGQEITARLAMRWKTAYAHNCVGFSVNGDGTVEATMVTQGENQETVVSFTRAPAIVSFRPGSAGVGAKSEGHRAQETAVIMDLAKDGFDQNILRIIPADPSTVDISEADFIVASGFGVGDKEGFDILQELARKLGASVAGTRRANDQGWIGMERRVGLTGKTVSPQVYMAVGISGAREHVVGMDESKVIIALNNHPKAEIFGLAHKGFIGDAKEVMTSLLKRLKSSDTT